MLHTDTMGADLATGVAEDAVADGGMLPGHVGNDPVLLVRRGDEYFAIGAMCSHYSGPLAEGLLVDDTVRCPWHHACFSIRTGEAVRAPALTPVDCWRTERRDGRIFVVEKIPRLERPHRASANGAARDIVIVGGGAAGFAAAELLRREGYRGGLTMISDDDSPPVDRPNLSKDYLSGIAPEDWLPLRDAAYYSDNAIDLRLNTAVANIDTGTRQIVLADGARLSYDRLLLATGAEPIRLPLPGMELPYVYTLRTWSDSRIIMARAQTARRAVVMGASFIGLEVAASLRARGLEVHVVAPDKRPLERVLGAQLGDFVRTLHEAHGVVFHLGDAAVGIDGYRVRLQSGAAIEGDFVVAGVGVRPRLTLAERAGLVVDRGVVVDRFLETSVPGIYAAGDIARWPDVHTGQAIRVEHWVVAQRQGQTAAMNMLGAQEAFRAVPFFWSQHYDVPINYVGHAEAWDESVVDGDIAGRDCVVRYKQGGRVLAMASVYRDLDNLKQEWEMELQAG